MRRLTILLAMAVLLGTCTPEVASQPTPAPVPTDAPTAEPSATVAPSPTVAPSATLQPSPTLVPSPTPVPPSPTPQPAAPAGQIYQKADGSLWFAEASGAPVQLYGPTEPEAEIHWALAPDERSVAFIAGKGIWGYQSDATPELALWLIELDGSNLRKLQDLLPPRELDQTPGGGIDLEPLTALTFLNQIAWSPDGDLIAFGSMHNDQVDLFTYALSTGTLTQLTNTPALEFGPLWSSDGAHLAALTATALGTGAGWADAGLLVLRAAGGPPVMSLVSPPLANGDPATSIEQLHWLRPDLLVAAFGTLTSGIELRAVDLQGGQTTIAESAELLTAVAWSTATETLAFSSLGGLQVWRPGAPRGTPITQDPVVALEWSPAGDVLAYAVTADGHSPGVLAWALGADGDIRRISSTPAYALCWSPDGRQISIDGRVYAYRGGEVARLEGFSVSPLAWNTAGLFLQVRREQLDTTHELWYWDGVQHILRDEGLK